MYSLALYFNKNYNFVKDFFYFRLYNYDINLYEKLSLYHNSMYNIDLFFFEKIQSNNYIINFDEQMIDTLKLHNNELKSIHENYSEFISKFDDNCFNIMFSDEYLKFLKTHISEDFIYISSYIMKHSKHIRFNMLQQLKSLNSYSTNIQLDKIEHKKDDKKDNEKNEVKQEN
jgi:hypothetical protein